MSKRTLVAVGAACLIAGYLISCVPGFDPVNPFVPKRPDRPVARLLARMAKLGLWVMVFAEPAPQRYPQPQYARMIECSNGVCHSEGW
jgi:hypothetical protein